MSTVPEQAVEHHLTVTKTARYWTLGGATESDTAGDEEVWFVLHGYKQLARRFLKRFTALASPELLVVAPEALSRFYVSQEPGRHGPASVVGATWMTREDRVHEIEDYVGYLDRLAKAVGVGDRKVTVLGFSQGVATAVRWVVHGSVQPSRLVLWGEVTPPDLDLALAGPALAGIELLLVRGDQDRAFDERLVSEESERLDRGGIDYEVVSYSGGHEIDEPTLLQVARR